MPRIAGRGAASTTSSKPRTRQISRAGKTSGPAPAGRDDRFFRHLVLNFGQGVLAITGDGRVAAINAIAYRVLGLHPRETDVGQPYTEVLRDCPQILAVLASAGDRAPAPESAALRLRHTGRSVGYTVSPVQDDEGQQLGLTLSLNDLTRAEQLEERDRVRDRLATLGTMAAAIAHEVKNPLASIEVMAGILRRQLSDRPEAAETLSDIIKESRMANTIVVEVLEFVRPIHLQVESAAIREILEDAVQALGAARHGIDVEVDADVPLLTADAGQLRLLFTNLITNAVEATASAGDERRIAVHASCVPDGGSPPQAGHSSAPRVKIEVRDNGPGIAEHDLARIFSPFFTTKPQSTGLGLSIVRKIVDAHDGTIRATSAPGRGTIFRVTLPVVPAPGCLTEPLNGTNSRR